MKQRPWRNDASWLVLYLFAVFTAQDFLYRGGTAHRKLSPLISIICQENILQTSLQASLTEHFSNEVFSFQMTLVGSKLTKQRNKN